MTKVTMRFELDDSSIAELIRGYVEAKASDTLKDVAVGDVQIYVAPSLRAVIEATGKDS